MIQVSVLGATGYTGAELLRLLQNHPQVTVTYAGSRSYSGQSLKSVYSNFENTDLVLMDADADAIAQKSEVAFLCLPHKTSMQVAPQLIERGCKVIDLSGDYRYQDTDTYEQWYNITHTEKELNKRAVYGLPEYYRSDIQGAQLVANPGCYTTASILALAPLLKQGLVEEQGIIIDAKSGVTGAGRQESLAFSFCESEGNFNAYAATGHRHTSEIEERLELIGGGKVQVGFTPHLLPVKRGILATIYAPLAASATELQLQKAYDTAYGDEPYTHVLPMGELPQLKQVVGSNNCLIGYTVDERNQRLIVVSCIDNLIKGAAGQALQNFNLMYGLDECTALSQTGWYL